MNLLLADAIPGLDVLGGSVIGVVLVLSLMGYIWFKPAVDRLIADKEKAEAQRDSLVSLYEEKVIPVLADVQGKVLPLLESIAKGQGDYERQLRAVADALMRLTTKIDEFGRV